MRDSRSILGGASARLLHLLLLSVLFNPVAAFAGAEVSDFKTRTEKWIETRQIISEEKSEWEGERDSLRATRDLLGNQKRALEEKIAELEETSSFADEERRELLLTRGEHQRTGRALDERIRQMETEVLELAPRLPEPLQKKIEPLLVQIPKDPDNTRQTLGARLMNVLGVLAQTEKWNSTATFVGETRAVAEDRRIAIRTLYWGLGQAFYVDTEGSTAGVGRPGPEGWVFVEQPDLAGPARELLDIYEGNVDTIEFVRLPIEVR
jgi:hypothetical protein